MWITYFTGWQKKKIKIKIKIKSLPPKKKKKKKRRKKKIKKVRHRGQYLPHIFYRVGVLVLHQHLLVSALEVSEFIENGHLASSSPWSRT